MSKIRNLIIVESPAKTKTIAKMLGKDYKIIASFGHIRDLPSYSLGIDVDDDFKVKYEVSKDKKKYVDNIKKEVALASHVFLATDPDREGEAISWHISEIFGKNVSYNRIVFNSIDKDSIVHAINNARDIDDNLVLAQKSRRILDRLSGYKGSSWLNKFLQDKKLSCGRVQSVALKFLVDREKEIINFIPKDYFNILIDGESKGQPLSLVLYKIKDKKVESKIKGKIQYLITEEEKANKILEKILSNKELIVSETKSSEIKKKTNPPYITSSLQQDASTKLGYNVAKTMKIAQNLYEGISGNAGLITYMRTDSFRIEPKIIKSIREHISSKYPNSATKTENKFSSRKSSQDAHEAIRPVSVNVTPDSVKHYLSNEQYKVYDLIWKRAIASQMSEAVYSVITAHISDASKEHIFKISHTTLKKEGYLAIYNSSNDSSVKFDLEEGDKIKILNGKVKKSTTKAPDRFSEASLVKKMEAEGVGRPSTYAPTITRLSKYIDESCRSMKPTDKAIEVSDALDKHLPIMTSVDFTSNMEEELELVEDNKKNWIEVVREFWNPFKESLDKASKDIASTNKKELDKECPNCGKQLLEISWRDSTFIGCSGYPKCKYVESNKKAPELDKSLYVDWFDWDQKCCLCSGDMSIRKGPYGLFLGCSKYPKCRGIVGVIKKEQDTGKMCSLDDGGHIIKKTGKRGSVFICHKEDCKKLYSESELEKL